MKKIFLSLITVVALWLGATGTANAQYILKAADAQYNLYNYTRAIDLYEQAYKKRASLYAAERLASSYEMVQNYGQTESWAAIAAGMEGTTPENVLKYAKALQHNSKYAEAKVQYEKYASLNANISASQKSLWLLSCDSAIRWMKNPSSTAIKNLKSFNSAQSDWGAVKTQGNVVFASDRTLADTIDGQGSKPFLRLDGVKRPNTTTYGWTGNAYLHLYTQRDIDSSASLFPLNSGTDYHVGPASFTKDGKEMYFTLTRIPKKPVFVKGKLATINIEIYSCSKNADGKWSDPIAFAYNRVNEYSVGDPSISADGRTLYLVSNMEGGQGGMDIYYCLRRENGEWGLPINLMELNTAGNERSPFFDGERTFYFSSDGRIGMGGLDIFKSTISAGKANTPTNMGYPINSPQDDFAFNLSDIYEGYLSSSRNGGMGSDDIYGFKAQEPTIFKLNGIAYNKNTNEPLANAIITLSNASGSTLKMQTEADGKYGFNLAKASDYNLTAEKTDFRSDVAKLSTQNLSTSTQITKDLFLEPIVMNKAIRLENIYYDFDRANIRPDAANELDKLITLMQDNPTIWIELGSHTDSRGNDRYNQKLSQQRANAVVRYIIERGINRNRVSAMGYGESQLLNSCTNGAKCTEAEHQLNRRTEFKIVKY